MRRRWHLAVAAALLLAAVIGPGTAACAGVPADAPPAGPPEVRVDAEIRAGIQSVIDALFPENEALMDRIARLERMTDGRRGDLVVQMALYLGEAQGTKAAMGGALLFQHLAFTTEEKLDALLPRLESGDEAFRRAVRQILSGIDRPDGGDPDFTVYEERLGKRLADPDPALVRYLFEVSPDAALDSLMRLHGAADPASAARSPALEELRELGAGADRGAPLPPEEAERARSALSTASKDPRWWVRSYAAAVLERDPSLALPEVRARLRADLSPIVRSLLP